MGTAAVEWSCNEFLFLMNRDKSDFFVSENVVAKMKGNLRTFEGQNEMWGGSWFGYRTGRLAFVVDKDDSQYGSTLVGRFLKSKMDPLQFAEKLEKEESRSFGLKLHLVLADLASETMVYVSGSPAKEGSLYMVNVGPGFHTFSEDGFDSDIPKDADLRDNLSHMIYRGKDKSLWGIANTVMTTHPVFKAITDASGSLVVPHTKHLVGMEVRLSPAKEHFCEWIAPDVSTIEYYGD